MRIIPRGVKTVILFILDIFMEIEDICQIFFEEKINNNNAFVCLPEGVLFGPQGGECLVVGLRSFSSLKPKWEANSWNWRVGVKLNAVERNSTAEMVTSSVVVSMSSTDWCGAVSMSIDGQAGT